MSGAPAGRPATRAAPATKTPPGAGPSRRRRPRASRDGRDRSLTSERGHFVGTSLEATSMVPIKRSARKKSSRHQVVDERHRPSFYKNPPDRGPTRRVLFASETSCRGARKSHTYGARLLATTPVSSPERGAFRVAHGGADEQLCGGAGRARARGSARGGEGARRRAGSATLRRRRDRVAPARAPPWPLARSRARAPSTVRLIVAPPQPSWCSSSRFQRHSRH